MFYASLIKQHTDLIPSTWLTQQRWPYQDIFKKFGLEDTLIASKIKGSFDDKASLINQILIRLLIRNKALPRTFSTFITIAKNASLNDSLKWLIILICIIL